jgi:uncharacterized protein
VSGLIDPELAAILVCPVDRAALTQDLADSSLVCSECGRRYPVVDGIPVMLVDEAGSPAEQ